MSESKYHMTPEKREQILDDAATFLAEMMFEITTKYKGLEKDIGAMLVHQTGAYISICAKNPQEALVEAANALGNTDYGRIRAAHYGYATLGKAATKPLVKPSGDVVQLGDPRNRRRTDD